jgi:hypothetical protein
MVIFRYLLMILVVIMGLARLRIVLVLLGDPTSYSRRDILQEYLLAKALLNGINPYLPLNELAQLFIGNISFMTHPAPYPPFIAVLSVPLTAFNLHQVINLWFSIEMICLLSIAIMLVYLWKGHVELGWVCLFFFGLLTWYSVMVDLLFGQLTILLTTLLFGTLLAIRKDQKLLAGILLGLTISIKMFTWPLIIYFVFKKDWRTVISSCITAVGLNLVALFVIGIGPVMGYYLKVTMQVSAIYHSFLKNYSLWSIGYRFFEGTRPVGNGYISAPPLFNIPQIAPYVSMIVVVAFLMLGLKWAVRSKDQDIAFAIMILVIVGISPISWDHYYVMIVISMAILLLGLSKASFPTWQTILFITIAMMVFIFNEHIAGIMFFLNGGIDSVQANGNQISFASSLLEILPMIQLVVLAFLLWHIGLTNSQIEMVDRNLYS